MHKLVAQRVQGGEHPATAGTLLIGDRTLLKFDGEVARQRTHAAIVGGRLEHAGRNRRVRRDQVGAVLVEILGVRTQKFGFDGPCAGVCRHDAPV